jgi:hypothetical protein
MCLAMHYERNSIVELSHWNAVTLLAVSMVVLQQLRILRNAKCILAAAVTQSTRGFAEIRAVGAVVK